MDQVGPSVYSLFSGGNSLELGSVDLHFPKCAREGERAVMTDDITLQHPNSRYHVTEFRPCQRSAPALNLIGRHNPHAIMPFPCFKSSTWLKGLFCSRNHYCN